MLQETIKIFLKGGIILRVLIMIPSLIGGLLLLFWPDDKEKIPNAHKEPLGYSYNHARYIYPEDTAHLTKQFEEWVSKEKARKRDRYYDTHHIPLSKIKRKEPNKSRKEKIREILEERLDKRRLRIEIQEGSHFKEEKIIKIETHDLP